ncbi:hypothetical protein LSCM1_07746 [Leishmania martiniquensis]|uniref:Sperm-tail PG-rich repeat n=1 Tax=Leishmania martiniquensis TaxID=1580590 RepID=A0A836HZ94_9TRYP|nr:hypothetical protein LSCM1_07746 [Leishmania martiniquensis]
MPSSSYAAYLREVALDMNAIIAPVAIVACPSKATTDSTVAAPPRRPSRSGRRRADHASRSSGQHTSESCGDSYAYDYLQVPAMGSLSRSSAVQLYEEWQQQRRRAQARTTRATAAHSPLLSYTTNSPTAHAARQDREPLGHADAVQRSFQRFYAVLKDEGRRQAHAAASSERAAPLSHFLSGLRQRRRQEDVALRQTCPDVSAVVRVPSMDFDSDDIIVDDRRHRAGVKTAQTARGSVGAEKAIVESASNPRVAAGSTAAFVKASPPTLTSTDTSALTSSPSKPSASSSRSGSPLREPRARRHQKSPYCSHRYDSCHRNGLPDHVNAHARRSRGVIASAADGECRTRSSSPACGRRVSSAEGAPTSRSGATAASNVGTADTVRLQWPHQARTIPTRRPLPRSPQDGRRHRHGDRRVGRLSGARCGDPSTTAASMAVAASARKRIDHEKGEVTLRDIATRSCACYWAELPSLTMAVNPASHAAGCPYQAHEALYTEVMLTSKVDHRSRSASTSSHSRCPSSASSNGRYGVLGRRSSSRQRRRAPLRQAVHDPKVKRTRGRAAVMGSTTRRTYMEVIMDAARDAPQSQPSRSGGCSGRAKATPCAAAGIRPSCATAQGGLPTGEALPAPQDEQPPQQPSRRRASESGTVVTAAEDQHNEAGEKSREERGPSDDVGTIAGHTAPGVRPSPPKPPKQPLSNEESPLRALSRPRRRPAVGVPGPGSYHVDLAYAASSAAHGIRAAAIPKAARMPAIKSTTPGPGTYDVQQGEEKRKGDTGDAVATGTATTADEGATDGKDAGARSAADKDAIGKGVVFSRTGARQLQLQYGDAYVHSSTWAKRAAALPGPGAYNLVGGDRFDQSKPLGEARMGYRFSKSADGAHFCAAPATATAADAAAAGGGDRRHGAASSSPTPASERAGARAAAAAATRRASLVLPWRDWAGGAYIGTTTSNFVAHPSLAGGDRRIIGHSASASPTTANCSSASAAAAAAAAAAVADGSVWRGVGSGVALRLTSQRFPVKAVCAPAAGAVADAKDPKAGSRAYSESAASPCEEPGPGTYELESALRLVQRRAPAVSMTFRHDRGPRGPLRSAGGGADDDVLAGGGGAALPQRAASPDPISGDLRFGPGPGTYDVRCGEAWCMRHSPQWSFGTAARHASSTLGCVCAAEEGGGGLNGWARDTVRHPGPGAYDLEAGYRALQRSASSALICTAPRFTVDDSSGARFPASSPEDGVSGHGVRAGPGTYDVESGYAVLHERIKGGVVPRAGADACTRDEGKEAPYGGPGPGAYTLPALPPSGPTAYLRMSSPRFPWEPTLAAVTADRGGSSAVATASGHPPYLPANLFPSNAVTPGPGDYDVDAATRLVNRPGAIIGRAPRASLLVPTGATSTSVGPGSYMLPTLPAGRGAVIPTARATAPAEAGDAAELPGPGLYNPVDIHASSARTFSLARTSARFPDNNHAHAADSTPGPCAYGVPAVPTGRSVVFDTAPRFSPDSGGGGTSGDGVGPGAYEVVDLSPPGRSAVIGSAVARPTLERRDGDGGSACAVGGAAAVPGPGAYSPQYSQVEERAPRVVLARASPGRGPADYNVSGDTSMPFHGQFAGAGSGLGPGQYDPQYPPDLVQAGRGYTFGSAPRTAAAAADAVASGVGGPGPGAYEVRVLRDGRFVAGGDGNGGVRFGTVPRLAEVGTAVAMSAGPGPGAYTPEAFTDMGADPGSAVASPAGRFGKAARIMGGGDARAAAGVPGPGAYEPNPGVLWPTAPSASFPRADGTHALGETDTPGPGAYVTAAGAMARAAQFGSAPRFAEGGADGGTGGAASLPGPNAYSPNDEATRPTPSAHQFGTAARQAGLAEEAAERGGVGPGAYDIEAGLAHSSRVPSPAAYSFPRAGSNLGDRDQRGEAGGGPVVGPGPGAYSLDAAFRATLPRVAAAAFSTDGAAGVSGARLSDAGPEPSPGPGAYDVADAAVRPSAPGVRFGAAQRYAWADAPVGGFEAAAAVGAQAGGLSPTPGPGAYWPNMNASSTLRSTRVGPTFAQASRMAPSAPADAAGGGNGAQGGNIGPGAYDLTGDTAASAAAAHRFGTAPRMPLASSSATAAEGDVGPGCYVIEAADPHVRPRAPAYKMASPASHAARQQEPQPGPGSYECPVAVQEHRRSALMLSRHGDSSSTARETPGPGAYDAAVAYASTQVARQAGGFTMQGRPAAAHCFGTAPRMERAASSHGGVGPGTYDLPAPPASCQAASFSQAPRAVAVGPYQGNEEGPQRGDVRGGGIGGGTPGPGTYDVGSAIECTQVGGRGPSFTIPRGPRPVLRSGDVDASPLVGPGTYSPADLTSHRHSGGSKATGPSAAFGLAQRPLNTLNGSSDAPGPGTYDLHHPSMANGIGIGPSFGSAARMDDAAGATLATTPGPGAYAVAPSFNATSASVSTPAVHFSSAQRPSAPLSENPGPGSYALADYDAATRVFTAAPSFGQAARPDVVLNTNPGPGAYHREGGAGSFGPWTPSVAARAATATTFGQAEQRPHLARCGLDTPGPGYYYRASTLDSTSIGAGPSFGVGERMNAVAGTATPGPGAYFKESSPVAVGSAPGPTFGLAERPALVLNTSPSPGAYHRDSAATDAAEGRGVSFGSGKRTSPVLNSHRGPDAYFKDTRPATAIAAPPRPRRPTAADTLRKLASVGYPTLASTSQAAPTSDG